MSVLTANEDNIAKAARAIKSGALVAFPTETVYGLGANALDGIAVATIFEAKGRPQFNPLIVHFSDAKSAFAMVKASEMAHMLAAEFWPGPLSMILPRRHDCPISDLCSAGLPTLAVRVPAHPVARRLLEMASVPIAAPSANPSGKISPTSAQHVAQNMGEKVAIILAAGRCETGLESSIIDLSGDAPVIVRPGAITAEQIARCLGVDVTYDLGDHNDAPKSPGQLLKHYAPSVPMRLNAVDVEADEALLAFGPTKFMGVRSGGALETMPDNTVLNLSESGDLYEAAANLFAMIHQLDRPRFKSIAVMNIPDSQIGIAINDRLRRAAAGSA
jgi:L-threonylcarbamoyladenylate synthase